MARYEDELRSLLFDCLKDKRYLVVLDDIWEIEAWNEVSAAFPNNSNGSRILITSRIKKVALHVLNISNAMCYTMLCMLEWMRKEEA